MTRQVLADQSRFEPFSLYQFLDSDTKGFLISADFWRFLNERKMLVSERECCQLVKEWDSNRDGKLSFQDFLDWVLPSGQEIRDKVLERKEM